MTSPPGPLLDALLQSGDIGIDLVDALYAGDVRSPLGALTASRLGTLTSHRNEPVKQVLKALGAVAIVAADPDRRGSDRPPRWYLTETGLRLGQVFHDLRSSESFPGELTGVRRTWTGWILSRAGEARHPHLQEAPAAAAAATSDLREQAVQLLTQMEHAPPGTLPPAAGPPRQPFHPASPLVILTPGPAISGQERSPAGLRILLALHAAWEQSRPATVSQIASESGVDAGKRAAQLAALRRAGLAGQLRRDGEGDEKWVLTSTGLVFAQTLISICETGPAGVPLLGALGVWEWPWSGHWERLLEALCFPGCERVLREDQIIGGACEQLAVINETISESLVRTGKPPADRAAPWPDPVAATAAAGGAIHRLAGDVNGRPLLAIIDALSVLRILDTETLAKAVRRTGETEGVATDLTTLTTLGIVAVGRDDRGPTFPSVYWLTPPGVELAEILVPWGGSEDPPASARSTKVYLAQVGDDLRPHPAAMHRALRERLGLAPARGLMPQVGEAACEGDRTRLMDLERRLEQQAASPPPDPATPAPHTPFTTLAQRNGRPLRFLRFITRGGDDPGESRLTGHELLSRLYSVEVRSRTARPPSPTLEYDREFLKALYLAGLATFETTPPSPSGKTPRRLADRVWRATAEGQQLIDMLSEALTLVTGTLPRDTLRWVGVLDPLGTPSMLGLIRALSIPPLRGILLADATVLAVCQPLLELNASLGSESKVAERIKALEAGPSPPTTPESGRELGDSGG